MSPVVSDVKLLTVVNKELSRMFILEKKIAVILLGLPLLYGVLFSLAYSGHVIKDIPTVIYDQDQTPASWSVVQAFSDSERYNVIAQVTSQEAMEEYLESNEALAAVVIPPKFYQNIKRGMGSEVLVVTNATNVIFANNILTTSNEIIMSLNVRAGQKLMQGVGLPPQEALKTATPVRMAVRLLNNPTNSYRNFIMAGIGVNALQLAIMLATCTILNSVYRDYKSWQEFSSPVIVLGKMLPYWLIAAMVYLLFVAMITICFDVPLKGDISSLMIIILAFSFAVTNIGCFFSAIAKNEILAVQMPMLYIMPAFLFSGYSWPHLAMNEFSRCFSSLLPLTYSADVIRDIMLAGYAPQLKKNAVILFLFGGVMYAITTAVLAFRRCSAKSSKEVL